MELVYLWVEDYKNIHKQGFNFSPRFRCEYDGKTLTIDKNDDYIPDFFGKNINVTAIVGKNGSGKSSLLDETLSSLFGSPDSFSLIYIDNKIFLIGDQKKVDSIIIISTFKINKIMQGKLNADILYFDTENKCPPIRADIIENIENPSLVDGFTDLIYTDKYTQEYRDDNKVILDEYKVGKKLFELLNKNKNIYNNFFLFELRDFVILENSRYFFDLKYDISFYSDSDIISNEYIKKYDFIQESNYNLYLFHMFYRLDIYEIFFDECIKESKNNSYLLDYDKIYSILIEYNEKPDVTIDEYIEFEKMLFNNEGYITIDDITTLKDIYFKFYTFTPYDRKNRTILDLSFGEQNIISQFIFLLHKAVFSSQKNILIVLDEIDISLHPSWQKRYVNEIIQLFSKIDKNIHFLLSTHSPFLLSDIPKQNIIFLDQDEQGNCKVVDGLKEKKQTFGANIHTLLSDSFFMEDGLMGEFAKGKINEIINFHKEVEKESADTATLTKEYEEKRDKFYQTHSIIGEEYLKQIVENHLLEIDKLLLGKDRAKEELIKRKEQEIERLKNG